MDIDASVYAVGGFQLSRMNSGAGHFLVPRYRRSGIGAVLTALLISGCAVETPQPAPPQKGPFPTVPAPQSTPPSSVAPTPKTYSGSYIERLEANSRDALAGTSVRVLRNGNTIKLIIPVNAAFAANSVQLQPRFSSVLDTVARLCRDYNKTTIAVKGFTDSTGSFEYNQQLSERRAQSIGAYLGRDVAITRIHTAGYGPRYPIADNQTDSGRLQNRRVEIDMVATP